MGERLLGMRQVIQLTGKSRSTIWRWSRDGRFPKPRLVGVRRLGWLESEIERWMKELPLSPTYEA